MTGEGGTLTDTIILCYCLIYLIEIVRSIDVTVNDFNKVFLSCVYDVLLTHKLI